MNPADPLLEDGRVPGQVHVDHDGRCMLQVQAHPARIGCEEDPTGRVAVEVLDERAALRTGYAAMEQHVTPSLTVQAANDELMGTKPLAEDDDLDRGLLEQLLQESRELVALVSVVGLAIEKESAVAGHSHVLQRRHEPAPVDVGQIPGTPPALHDLLHEAGVALVFRKLLARHLHEDRLGDTLRKLREHVGLAPAEHHGPQGLSDPIQILVAHDASGVIDQLVLVAQSPEGPEPLAVDVLHDRHQLLQAVLERRSAQHQRIGTLYALERSRGDRAPVLDPLRLVRDHDIGRARRAGAKPDLPLASVAQIDLAVPGTKASPQCPHSPGTTLEAREYELDVLAGTQIIRAGQAQKLSPGCAPRMATR